MMLKVFTPDELTDEDLNNLRNQNVEVDDLDFVIIAPENDEKWRDSTFIHLIRAQYDYIKNRHIVFRDQWVRIITAQH